MTCNKDGTLNDFLCIWAQVCGGRPSGFPAWGRGFGGQISENVFKLIKGKITKHHSAATEPIKEKLLV